MAEDEWGNSEPSEAGVELSSSRDGRGRLDNDCCDLCCCGGVCLLLSFISVRCSLEGYFYGQGFISRLFLHFTVNDIFTLLFLKGLGYCIGRFEYFDCDFGV